MIYPQHFEQKIGFDQIKEMIRKSCISGMGMYYVDKIRFSSRKEIIEMLLDQVSEFRDILMSGESFPSTDYFDLREELFRLKTPGSYIDQESLFNFRSSINTITEILAFFKSSEEGDYPELKNLCHQVFIPEELLLKADRIIDAKGEIKSNASEKLLDIRKQIESKLRKVNRETKKAFELAKKSGWVTENAEITIRDGRAVIPLTASNKRAVGGFIHDESATGQTVFF